MENGYRAGGVASILMGVLFIIVPTFLDNPLLSSIGKPAGYGVMFIGIILLVAGKQVGEIFKKIFNKKEYDKMKSMTAEEIIEYNNKQHAIKINQMKQTLEIERTKAEIERIKAKTARLKTSIGSKTDIMANLGFGQQTNTKKKDTLEELKKMM